MEKIYCAISNLKKGGIALSVSDGKDLKQVMLLGLKRYIL